MRLIDDEADVGFCARLIADMLHDADPFGNIPGVQVDFIIRFYANLFFGGISALLGNADNKSKILSLMKKTINRLLPIYDPRKKLPQHLHLYFLGFDERETTEERAGSYRFISDGGKNNPIKCVCEQDKCITTLFVLFDSGSSKETCCKRTEKIIVPGYKPELHPYLVPTFLSQRGAESIARSRSQFIKTTCFTCENAEQSRKVVSSDGIVLLDMKFICREASAIKDIREQTYKAPPKAAAPKAAPRAAAPKAAPKAAAPPKVEQTAPKPRKPLPPGTEIGVRVVLRIPTIIYSPTAPNIISNKPEERSEQTPTSIILQLREVAREFHFDINAAKARDMLKNSTELWTNFKDVSDGQNFVNSMSMMYVEHMFKFLGDFGQIISAIETDSAVSTVDNSMKSIAYFLGLPVARTGDKVGKVGVPKVKRYVMID